MKFLFKGKIIELDDNGKFKNTYNYNFNEEDIDIDFLYNIFELIAQPNTSIDREYIKKQIEEI